LKIIGSQKLTRNKLPNGGKWVIKREFSANCDHIEIVDLDAEPLKEADSLEVFQKAWADTEYTWIYQEYIPLLEQWGEWRVFLINGKTACTVMTTKDPEARDGWHWNQKRSMYTLKKLTAMWKENPNIKADDVGFPKGLTTADIKEANEEINRFAETTLSHHVKAEHLAYHHTPSISLFCRLDIGIMPDSTGNLQYFVNEVTRGPTQTCLFSGTHPDVEDIAPNLGTEFAVAFYNFMCSEHPGASTPDPDANM